MFVRVKTTPNSPRCSVQVCETRRTGATVRQTIVRYVGVAMDAQELDALKQLAEVIRVKLEQERSESLPLFAPEEIVGPQGALAHKKRGRPSRAKALGVDEVRLKNLREETRVIEGVQEVFGALFSELGFHEILEKDSLTHILKTTVLARLANPVSKHRTAALLERDFGISVPLDRIYRMMDALYKARESVLDKVRRSTLALFPEKIDVVFFDVTTLYFESETEDTIRDFGYSKDQKFHSVQVVLALATTESGLPIGYKLFPGATAEVKTLLSCLADWKGKFDIAHVVFVADRAMMCEANLKALEEAGVEYIVAAPMRREKARVKEEILAPEGYRLAGLLAEPVWVKEIEIESGRRLIASFSAKRARKDAADRDRILESLTKRLGKEGGLKKLVSNRGYLKYAKAEGKSTAAIDEAKVAADAAWDGMHGVITNSKREALHVLARYRELWSIEAAFRLSKHDLAMRPIFHFKPERIEAHIAICFIAYAIATQATYRLKLQKRTLSFDVLRNELLAVQATILRDKTTGARYRLPSNMTQAARDIYGAFTIKRDLTPTLLQE